MMKITYNINVTQHKNNTLEYDFGISFFDARWLLIESSDFRYICTDILKNIPYDDYYSFFGKFGHKNYEKDPFKIIVKKTTLDEKEDIKTYSEHFKNSKKTDTICIFPNLSKNALLLVPKPIEDHKKNCYSSLANFMRQGPEKQINDFWISFANTTIFLMDIPLITKETGAIWINTHGDGVSYLHVRFDTSPKYLEWVPKLKKSGSGKWAKYIYNLINITE